MKTLIFVLLASVSFLSFAETHSLKCSALILNGGTSPQRVNFDMIEYDSVEGNALFFHQEVNDKQSFRIGISENRKMITLGITPDLKKTDVTVSTSAIIPIMSDEVASINTTPKLGTNFMLECWGMK